MSVKIRLKRMGSKKNPFYRIVVADSRSPRDGRFIEQLGYYSPLTEPVTIKLDNDATLAWLQKGAQPSDTVRTILSTEGIEAYNLGTGIGYSVLDVVKNFEKATGKKVPYTIVDRRPGDIATCYSDASKAAMELDWKAEHSLEDMCRDSWKWQENNPNGYE